VEGNKTIKITSHQLLAITACSSLGGSLLAISSTVATISKQDAWLVALINPIFGLLILWLYYLLGSRYPDKTLIGISREILGKVIGTIVSVGYILAMLLTYSHIAYYIGDFVGHNMHETPVYAINMMFFFAAAVAVLYGIETIGRASELFLIFVTSLFFLSMLFVAPNAQLENLMPVLEKGPVPVLKGCVFLSALVTFPMAALLMMFPVSVDNVPEAAKGIVKGYLISSLIVFVSIFLSVTVLGSTIVAKSSYPTLFLVREINVGMVITRLEYFVSAIWIITQLCVCAVFSYAGTMGTAELLSLKDYRKIVWPLALIALVMSEIELPDPIYQANWLRIAFTPYIFTYAVALPVLLLIVYSLKQAFKRMSQTN